MKWLICFMMGLYSSLLCAQNFYDFELDQIGKNKIYTKELKGKVVLVVNIATACGYTPQLDSLEKIYQKYSSQGFVVIGIPSNEFGGQTPETNEKVADFCKKNYGVTFPVTTKQTVLGDKKNKLIELLIKQSNEKNEIEWNFEKFLINKEGRLVQRFKSSIAPDDKILIQALEKHLK